MKQYQLASPPPLHQPVVHPNSWPTQKDLRQKSQTLFVLRPYMVETCDKRQPTPLNRLFIALCFDYCSESHAGNGSGSVVSSACWAAVR